MPTKQQFEKAAKWLETKTNYIRSPVVVNRKGYAEFICFLFKVDRDGKPSIWFAMDIDDNKITKIRRICNS